MAQDWGGSEGFGVWVRAEKRGAIILTVLMGQPGDVSPFDLTFETTGACWQDWIYTFLLWSDFEPASWAEAGSADVLDPAQIVGYGFTLDAYGGRRTGTLLLDVIGPIAAPSGVDGEPEETLEPAAPPKQENEDAALTGGGGICLGSLALPVAISGVRAR